MADVFRLLIRSTNLPKGIRPPPSNLEVSTSSTALPPTKKRKKNTGENVSHTRYDDALPRELDFFRMGVISRSAVELSGEVKQANGDEDGMTISATNEEDEKNEEEDDKGELEDDGAETTATLPSEEDTRRHLQEHKLKFTILSRGQKAPASSLPGEKKKKADVVPAAITDEERRKQRKRDKKYTLPLPPMLSFSDLRSPVRGYSLSRRLYANILAQGYTTPTEVQMGAFPVLMNHPVSDTLLPELLEVPAGTPVDLLTCAPTGSGKTLAYVVPLLDSLLRERNKLVESSHNMNKDRGVKAVILAPTKELVTQIVNEVRKLCLGTGLRASSLKKGHIPVSVSLDTTNISLDSTQQFIKSDIVVSTPLTFLHSLSATSDATLQNISTLILDEADILLDSLFRDQTTEICTKLRATSPNLQTTLWSATINSSTESFFSSSSPSRLMANPVLRLVVGIKDTSIPTIAQKLLYTNNESGKLLALRQLLTSGLKPPLLVFVQSIPRAQALYNELQFDLPTSGKIAVLHAGLSDTAREEVMERFRNAQIWVLVTTDVLARGIDFRGVRQVVNYDIPTSVAAYIHRIGRTGRTGGAGKGEALTYYTKEDFGRGIKGIAGVIEASKKQRKAEGGEGETEEESTNAQWLIDALPKTDKKRKQQMKKFGVEARRGLGTGAGGDGNSKEAKISTKASWVRRREERRKGAIEGSRRRKRKIEEGLQQEDGDEEWAGLSD